MNIKDKIAKLLALADSPDPNEAKAALLKARALMAKHKLSENECEKAEDVKVVKELVEITCTAQTDPWIIPLSAIIANAYCCHAFNSRVKKGRTYHIGFVGLEDDFEVCKRVFLYAYNAVISGRHFIKKTPSESATDYREKCNAYGFGFAHGVKKAFQEQTEQRQEWGLVMAVPQAVTEATSGFSKRPNPGRDKTGAILNAYRNQGYRDGLKFSPASSIEEGHA